MTPESDNWAGEKELLKEILDRKKAWRKTQAALPFAEKVKILERLRERLSRLSKQR